MILRSLYALGDVVYVVNPITLTIDAITVERLTFNKKGLFYNHTEDPYAFGNEGYRASDVFGSVDEAKTVQTFIIDERVKAYGDKLRKDCKADADAKAKVDDCCEWCDDCGSEC